MSTDQFELVFDGTKDDSEETLTRLKGIFVSDLEFEVADVQRILSSQPCLVTSSDNEVVIKKLYSLLDEAGAWVRIVAPHDDSPASSLEAILGDPLSIDSSETPAEVTIEQKLSSEPSDTKSVLDFDLDLAGDSEPIIPAPALQPPSPEETDLGLTFELDQPESAVQTPSAKAQIVAAPIAKENEAPQPIAEAQPEFSFKLAASEEPVAAPTVEAAPVSALSLGEDDHPAITLVPNKTAENLAPKTEPESSASKSSSESPERLAPVGRLADILKQKKSQAAETPVPNSAEPDSPVEEELEAVATVNKKISRQTSMLILLALLATAALNWFLVFSHSSEPKENPFDKAAAALAKAAAAPPPPTIAPVAPVDPLNLKLWEFSGSDSLDWGQVEWKIKTIGRSFTDFTVAFSTPEPQGLSQEQIVRGEAAPIWVRRIEINELSLTYPEPGVVSGQGPAKVYYQRGEERGRAVADSVLTGTIDPQSGTLSWSITVKSAGMENPTTATVFEADNEGHVRIFASDTRSLSGTEPAPSPSTTESIAK